MMSIEDSDDLVEDVKYKENLKVESLVKEKEDEPVVVEQGLDNSTTTESSVSNQDQIIPTTRTETIQATLESKTHEPIVAEPEK